MTTVISFGQGLHLHRAGKPYGFGGRYSLVGTVSVQGSPTNTPAVRRVRLHDFESAKLVREVWSATDGTYAFNALAAGDYYVAAFDHTGTYNGVIKDRVTVLAAEGA